MRVGTGYDAHRFDPSRKLVLGGVEIDFRCGLAGHSDADVLLHAIGDALLGAAGLGDIGEHFPDTEPGLVDISSVILLGRVMELVRAAGYSVVNVDATVICEEPRILPHRPMMKNIIAKALEISAPDVNIKGTTTEGMGPMGRGEGISAAATVLLEMRDRRKDGPLPFDEG